MIPINIPTDKPALPPVIKQKYNEIRDIPRKNNLTFKNFVVKILKLKYSKIVDKFIDATIGFSKINENLGPNIVEKPLNDSKELLYTVINDIKLITR